MGQCGETGGAACAMPFEGAGGGRGVQEETEKCKGGGREGGGGAYLNGWAGVWVPYLPCYSFGLLLHNTAGVRE